MKSFRNTLSLFLLASISTHTFAEPYPDVESMLEALRPTAAADAPELNTLIIALDAIPTEAARQDALETLIPIRDGSLRAASEGPMQQFHNVLFDRLVHVKKTAVAKRVSTGVNSGDQHTAVTAITAATAEKVATPTTAATAKVATKTAITSATATVPASTTKTATTTPAPTTIITAPATKIKTNGTATTTTTTTNADPEDPNTINGPTTTITTNGGKAATTTTTTNGAATTTTTTTDAATTDATATEATTITDTRATGTTTTTETPATTTTTVEVVDPKDIKKGAWIHVLGENIGQRERHDVPGYDADTLGIMIGRDVLQTPNYTIGLAVGYQNAEADQRNLSGSYLHIKRFQGTIYNAYEWDCPFFIHGAFTVAFNHYDNHRYMLVPPYGGVPLVHISNSLFWGTEINAYLETGFKWHWCEFQFTPKMMLGYTQFTFGSYIEDDAFGYDLDVKYHDMRSLPIGLGFKLAYQNEFDKAYVVPEIHLNFYHDFKNDSQTATAIFTGGGFEFLSQGAGISRDTIDIGVGMTVHSYVNTLVTIEYDYVARRDYQRQQAFIRVRHEWA